MTVLNNRWQAVGDNYNCREALCDGSKCRDAVRDRHNCREVVCHSHYCGEAPSDRCNCQETVREGYFFKRKFHLSIA